MAETTQPKIKINKSHGGKEFVGYFHFVGKISPSTKNIDNEWVDQPYYEEFEDNETGEVYKKKIQFNVETAKSNKIKLQLEGFKRDNAYAHSSKHKKSITLDFNDRNNEKKLQQLLPDNTYKVIQEQWDFADELKDLLKNDVWVDVRGKYEFRSFTNDDNRQVEFFRRTITSINVIENGAEINLGGQKKQKYITDFDSEEFVEINEFDIQIGVKSTYQDEEIGDVKVNAVFLGYGKEQSIPYDVELIVKKEQSENLAKSFANLKRGDFLRVKGTDNNRAEYSYVEIEDALPDGENPFAELDDDEQETQMERVASGTLKGFVITKYVKGSYFKELLQESELELGAIEEDDPELINEDDLPF